MRHGVGTAGVFESERVPSSDTQPPLASSRSAEPSSASVEIACTEANRRTSEVSKIFLTIWPVLSGVTR
jgi:hypothetical protein